LGFILEGLGDGFGVDLLARGTIDLDRIRLSGASRPELVVPHAEQAKLGARGGVPYEQGDLHRDGVMEQEGVDPSWLDAFDDAGLGGLLMVLVLAML